MKLSQFKKHLENVEQINFVLPNGTKIPSHFHITEVGMTTKQFTDCGNTFRISKTATFQLWTAVDFYHRLEPKKILSIINSSEKMFAGEDLEKQARAKIHKDFDEKEKKKKLISFMRHSKFGT